MIICSPELGLAPQSNSGGEVYDREVINRLCQNGVRVLTLLPKGRDYVPHKNLSVELAPIKTVYPPHLFSALVFPYLIRIYKRKHFNILRVHNPYFVGPAAAVFKKLNPQVPVVGSFLHLESGLNGLIGRGLIHTFDRIITISNSTKKEIIESFNYPGEKITVAYPGVDNRFQPGNPLSPRLQRGKKKVTIMFVGGLKARKNPEFLLKVMAKINRSGIELVFAGDGPLRDRLKGKNVRVTGYIPEKDKPELYQQADVVVLPSLKEGFGMTLIEAGASGLPTVGVNHYSIPEIIIDGKTGFLARVNDADDWAQKLIQLIKDKGLRLKMGRAARERVRQKFTWEKNIKTQLKIYENLIR